MSCPQDYKQAVETLRRIEQAFNTASLRCGEIAAWPVIRLLLWNKLISTLDKSAPLKASDSVAPIPDQLTGVKLWAARAVAPLRWNHFLRGLKKEGETDILLLSNRLDYSDKVEGTLFNRHIDPMYALSSRTGFSVKKMEISHPTRTPPRYFKTTIIPYSRFTKLPKPQKSIENLTALKDVINGLCPTHNIDADIVLGYINDLLDKHTCYHEVLSTLRPKTVFVACYYSQDAMAFISAAKRLGIKTVDIQHGKQGLYHGMYNHWSAIPKGGYDLLPDFFWVWGQESRRNILINNGGDVDAHMPLIGGNLWHGDWKRSVYLEEAYPPEYGRKLKRSRKVILFSAQPLGTVDAVIPTHVRKVIEKSSHDWFWLIRMHPHQKHLIRDFKEILDALGVNYDIETATNAPLLQILKTIDIHLTCWSSVAYEAMAFDKRTIIVHDTGRRLYAPSIENGTMELALESDQLLSLLRAPAKESPTGEIPYIETSLETATETLVEIMK